MYFHKNLVNAVINGLDLIIIEGKYADKVIFKLLKSNSKWGSRDRAFIAETIYEIIRWKRLYNEIIISINPNKENNSFLLFIVWILIKGYNPPSWINYKNIGHSDVRVIFKKLIKIRKFRHSIPDWIDKIGVKSFGEKKWDKELIALNEIAKVVIRTNRLKIKPEELKKCLESENVNTYANEEFPDALILEKRSNIFLTKSFKKGFFEVQDASSQCVAYFTGVKPGMRVIDACAGAGGKSLHLSALMENKGKIISLDIKSNKLNELRKRAKRANSFNIETKLINNSKVIKKLYNSADIVLIDAPCSGIGVLKRNPDAKWKLSLDFYERTIIIQKEILFKYSKMVKPGGLLVYATCSIFPDENENQIRNFLISDYGKKFKFIKEKVIMPSISNFDGFYMCKLKRA